MSYALVLNRNYIAISIVPIRRAIKMLYKGRAEVVDIAEGFYSSYDFNSWSELSSFKESMGIRNDSDYIFLGSGKKLLTPTVIRTLHYDGVSRERVKLTRRNIYMRDDYTCSYCGKKFKSDKLNIDHVIPKSRGGRNVWNNVVCSCVPCNTKKNDRTPEEAGMKIRRRPFEPRYNILLNYNIVDDRCMKTWGEFVDGLYWNTELKE